jgi:demethylspheroidene O-methyltransferase
VAARMARHPGGTGAAWLDRLAAGRDRLLASARFRHAAAAFPLTRPVARRRARALFDLCAGFVYSQILLACVRLGLFDRLLAGPQSAASLAQQLGLPVERARRLLAAAASLELLARRGPDRFGLGPLGAALAGNPAIAAMIEHHALLYADLRDPVALLRGEVEDTALGRFWPYARDGEAGGLAGDRIAAYSALMSASQPLVAGEVLDAYPIGRHRCLLDVGGGEGGFLTAAGARAPGLRLMLFDLPAVASRARSQLAGAGLADRAKVFGGDFRADPLPRGADVVSLVRVVHDHDDEAVLTLLRAARQALPAYGTLLVAEPMSDTPGAEPMGEAYFGFYLLAMGSGRPRSPAEHRALLQRAGFGRIRLLRNRLPLQTRILVAQPAATSTAARGVSKY